MSNFFPTFPHFVELFKLIQVTMHETKMKPTSLKHLEVNIYSCFSKEKAKQFTSGCLVKSRHNLIPQNTKHMASVHI